MDNLIDVVDHAVRVTNADDGYEYVLVTHNEQQYRRRVQHKPFSNWPIKYIRWGSKNYQVNTVREL